MFLMQEKQAKNEPEFDFDISFFHFQVRGNDAIIILVIIEVSAFNNGILKYVIVP